MWAEEVSSGRAHAPQLTRFAVAEVSDRSWMLRPDLMGLEMIGCRRAGGAAWFSFAAWRPRNESLVDKGSNVEPKHSALRRARKAVSCQTPSLIHHQLPSHPLNYLLGWNAAISAILTPSF